MILQVVYEGFGLGGVRNLTSSWRVEAKIKSFLSRLQICPLYK